MASKKSGYFITFEGGEGTGKSTQTRALVRWLSDQGIKSAYTLEPGGTQIGEEIRDLLLNPSNKHLSPRAELLLYEADRAQHVDEYILPNLTEGKIVICDRFFDSSTVYQGICRKLGLDWTHSLNRFATGGLQPDLTILLDLPENVGKERIKKRIVDDEGLTGIGRQVKLDRIEREDGAFHKQVRKGFLKMAKKYPSRIKVIDGTLSSEEIESKIRALVEPRLRRRKLWPN